MIAGQLGIVSAEKIQVEGLVGFGADMVIDGDDNSFVRFTGIENKLGKSSAIVNAGNSRPVRGEATCSNGLAARNV